VKGILPQPIAVVGAAAFCQLGLDWPSFRERCIGLLAGRKDTTLQDFPLVVPKAQSKPEKRQRRLMSRSALLATVALNELLKALPWDEQREELGCYMGVGASGGSEEQLFQLLEASRENVGAPFSFQHFGEEGLRSCNPLYAFQILHNFTLCHPSILHGLGGANSAFFSRGAGTTHALSEGAYAVLEGDCQRALVGGADAGRTPMAHAELEREGYLSKGLQAAEGAGWIALERDAQGHALGWLERCTTYSTARNGFERVTQDILQELQQEPPEQLVLYPWNQALQALWAKEAKQHLPNVKILELESLLGDPLAAGPALGWLAALATLGEGHSKRTTVLHTGIDTEISVVTFSHQKER